MKEFRLGKNTKEHYTSIEEMAKAWGCKPITKKTKDEKKLKEQQEKFCARHKCRACGQPMTWVGGSMMTCKNENCKGIKIEEKDAEGNIIRTEYLVPYDLLDEKGTEIAANIFS